MKVKLIKYIEPEGLGPNTYGLTLNKIYDVVAITHFRELKKLKYFVVDNDENISAYNEIYFEIIDNTLEKDFVIKNDIKTNSLYILPDDIDTSFFYDLVLFSETIRITPDFMNRFKHLFSDNKYAEVFPEKVHNPNIHKIAKAIGEGWVLCSECDHVFEVNQEEGVVKCTACYTKQNNPYINEKKF